MILPKSDPVYENLRTFFVEINNLLQALREDNFTGYVQITFWDYEGIIFIESGEIVNAFEESQGTKRGGEEAIEGILNQAKQKDGRINVYRLPPEMVAIFASTSMKEAAYKDLSTEFTSLDKLIDKLSKEELSGYIDITMNDKRGGGIIFFQDGVVVEAVICEDESNEIFGKDKLDQIIATVEQRGATFNVYRVEFESRPGISSYKGTVDLQGVKDALQEILKTIEAVVDGISKQKGTFKEALNKSQLTKSEEYPFLDPFAAEFEYKNGKITLDANVSVETFINGVKECIDLTLDEVTSGAVAIKKEDLLKKIRTEIDAKLPSLMERFEDLGLKAAMPSILGS